MTRDATSIESQAATADQQPAGNNGFGPAEHAPACQMRAVDFSYPGHDGQPAVRVLHQISLTIPRGQLWIILGPNGSGKTTLLRLLAGLLNPSAGQVLLDDISISRLSNRSVARRLAFVPQETQPAFDYTVQQVVLMGRSPHMGPFGFDRPGDVAIIRDCMSQTDTLHLEARQFDELSSGERQRVVIARALAQKPKVLLLDEPTAFLDIGHQLQIFRLLRKLATDGMTVVCVSHDLNVSSLFGDQLVLLNKGEVAAAGTAAAVLTPDIVRSVYQVDADVVPHPRTGRPVVIPHD